MTPLNIRFIVDFLRTFSPPDGVAAKLFFGSLPFKEIDVGVDLGLTGLNFSVEAFLCKDFSTDVLRELELSLGSKLLDLAKLGFCVLLEASKA